MALKSYKPTSPARRQLVLVDRSGSTRASRLRRSRAASRRPGAQPSRAHHGSLSWRWAQARVPDHRLQAAQVGRAGDGGAARVRSQPDGLHRAVALCRWRAIVHFGAAAAGTGRYGDRGGKGRHQAGQCAAAQKYSDRHDHPQCRAQDRQGWSARARGWDFRAAHWARWRLCAGAADVGRDPSRPSGVHGDHRRRLQPRPSERQLGQGGADAVEGAAAARPWREHEPDRPSARRR